MTDPRPTIAEINALDRDAFVARFGHLFEGSPWIVAEAWAARPFPDREALHRAMVGVVATSGSERKVSLIRAHPDLVGRAALSGTLDRASTAEQAAAGLDPDRLSPDEIAEFGRLNDAYRQRFGFPFVLCARENKKASILAAFAARLANDREREIAIAMDEVAKIAWYRLADAVRE
jgi:OHCU decarboxylase